MCKILCLTSHDPAKRNDIISRVWKDMTGADDGYGAAWISPTGEIGYFKRSYPRIDGYPLPDFCNPKTTYAYQKVKEGFSESNDVPSDGGFLIIHGRNATNAVNVANTHPMVAENAALVHNGVVNSTKHDNINEGCTCDSELLLNAYIEGGIEEVEKEINGYYAFMLLLVSGKEKKKTLHVARDGRASLECGIRPDGSYAFATTEYMLKVVDAEHMGPVKTKTLIVFDGPTAYSAFEFEPGSYTAKTKEEKEAVKTALGDGPTEDDEAEHMYREYKQTAPNGAASNIKTHTYPAKGFQEQWDLDSREIEALEQEAIIQEGSRGV